MAAIGVLVALILSLLPSLIEHSREVTLPWPVDFSITLALFLHIAGVSFNIYHDPDYWWFDLAAHFLGTVAIALLAFLFVYTLNFTGKIKMSIPLVGFFTFMIALAIGALWEIGEFSFDKIFKTNTLGDIVDTITDLQFDALGGVCVALFGMWYVHGKTKKKKWRAYFKKLAKRLVA